MPFQKWYIWIKLCVQITFEKFGSVQEKTFTTCATVKKTLTRGHYFLHPVDHGSPPRTLKFSVERDREHSHPITQNRVAESVVTRDFFSWAHP